MEKSGKSSRFKTSAFNKLCTNMSQRIETTVRPKGIFYKLLWVPVPPPELDCWAASRLHRRRQQHTVTYIKQVQKTRSVEKVYPARVIPLACVQCPAGGKAPKKNEVLVNTFFQCTTRTDWFTACLPFQAVQNVSAHSCATAPGDVIITAPLDKPPFFTNQINSSTGLGSLLPWLTIVTVK